MGTRSILFVIEEGPMKIHRVLMLLVFPCILFAQDTLTICTYNLLNYDTNTSRDSYFRTVIRHIQPDVLVVQEITSQAAVDNFFNNVVNTISPGEFARGTFINGPDTDNAIYFRTSKFTFVANTPIRTALRDINEFKLYSISADDTLRLYSVHLKASSGSTNEALRAAEVDSLRRVTNVLPNGKYFMVLGDFNIYHSAESAYQKLLQVNATDDGRFLDALNMTGTWNNSAYAAYHTQSPRTRGFGGGSTGGMDDRFDMILYSRAISEPGRIQYLMGSLTPVGNDGLHFNDSINRLPNFAVPDSVANALHYSSDHLPVSARFVFTDPSVSVPVADVPADFVLYQNYPNPFNPSTTISFTIGRIGSVSLKIYDVLGREVAMLVDGTLDAGRHDVRWEANVAGGVYVYRLIAEGAVSVRRMVLVR